MKNALKMIGCTIAGVMIGSATVVFANQAIQAMQNTEIKVSLNGNIQEFKDEVTGERQYPITYNNRTYLPLRNVAELSGLKVDFDSSSNTAILTSNEENNEIIGVNELRAYQPQSGVWFEISTDGKSFIYNECGKEVELTTNLKEEIKVVKMITLDTELDFVILTEDGKVFCSNTIGNIYTANTIEFYYLCENVSDIESGTDFGSHILSVTKGDTKIDVEIQDYSDDFGYSGFYGPIKDIERVSNDSNIVHYLYVLDSNNDVYYANAIFSNVQDDVIKFNRIEGIDGKISFIEVSNNNVLLYQYIGEVEEAAAHSTYSKYKVYKVDAKSNEIVDTYEVIPTT